MNHRWVFVLLYIQPNDLTKEDNKVTEFINREDVHKILSIIPCVTPSGWAVVGILYEKAPPPPAKPVAQGALEKSEPPAKKKPRRKGLR